MIVDNEISHCKRYFVNYHNLHKRRQYEIKPLTKSIPMIDGLGTRDNGVTNNNSEGPTKGSR